LSLPPFLVSWAASSLTAFSLNAEGIDAAGG
jgi:hypothetical protein